MYNYKNHFDNLNNWKITFDYKNPISSIKVFGKGLNIEELSYSKKIFLKNESNPLLKVFDNYVELYTFSSLFPTYYRINKNEVMISNVASELIFNNEEVLINNTVLIQYLYGANYPHEDFFNDIKLFASSTFYKFNNEGMLFSKSNIKFIKNVSIESVYNEIDENTNTIFNSKKPVAILLSGGYDSRLNLLIALDLQKKYGFKIYLFHEYKNEIEYKIAKKIADKLRLNLECIDRNFFDDRIDKIIFDKKFILYSSGHFRENIPRWICYLNHIKSKIPDALIFGLGAEAHKGKYYRKVLKNDDFKKVFGNDYPVFKLISKYLNIKIDKKFENSFFDKLIEDSKIFPELDSRIDYIHYHTYISNGFKKRFDVLHKLFDIPFPFVIDRFLSKVFSLKKEQKIDFFLVKDLLNKLNPELNKIEYFSANWKSLEGNKFNLKSFLRYDLIRPFLYVFKHPKRKGPDSLREDFINKIKNDRPKSHITKVLFKFLTKEKYIPVIRFSYALQLYNYFKLLEDEKNVTIKCS